MENNYNVKRFFFISTDDRILFKLFEVLCSSINEMKAPNLFHLQSLLIIGRRQLFYLKHLYCFCKKNKSSNVEIPDKLLSTLGYHNNYYIRVLSHMNRRNRMFAVIENMLLNRVGPIQTHIISHLCPSSFSFIFTGGSISH